MGAYVPDFIGLLQPLDFTIVVHDPFVSDEEAQRLVPLGEFAECFATSQIISNHLPNIPSTKELITDELLRQMPERATFINSARGQQVQQDALFQLCTERPDATAILDVTTLNRLPPESPAWHLPNIELTSHIAGSHGNETDRMVHYLCRSFDQFMSTGKLNGEITLDTWEQLA